MTSFFPSLLLSFLGLSSISRVVGSGPITSYSFSSIALLFTSSIYFAELSWTAKADVGTCEESGWWIRLPELTVANDSKYLRVLTDVKKAGMVAGPPYEVEALVGICDSVPKKFPFEALDALEPLP